jgi:hypothetical protein
MLKVESDISRRRIRIEPEYGRLCANARQSCSTRIYEKGKANAEKRAEFVKSTRKSLVDLPASSVGFYRTLQHRSITSNQ